MLTTIHVNAMYNNVVISAESCHKKHSTANRGPLSEERYDLLVAAIRGNPDKIPEVDDFVKQSMSYMYSGSCKTKPMKKGVEPYIGILVKGGGK